VTEAVEFEGSTRAATPERAVDGEKKDVGIPRQRSYDCDRFSVVR
jgi:hypothetical protein